MKSLLETYRSQSDKFFSKSGKIGEFCTSKNIFFLEFILWIHRMPFWQLCWELLLKSSKLSIPKSKIDWKKLFYASYVPSEYTSRHFPTEILRNFSWKSESVEFSFRNQVFGRMLLRTRRKQLWWVPEVSWLNPVNHHLKVRNWWEKFLLVRKFLSFKKLWHCSAQFR